MPTDCFLENKKLRQMQCRVYASLTTAWSLCTKKGRLIRARKFHTYKAEHMCGSQGVPVSKVRVGSSGSLL